MHDIINKQHAVIVTWTLKQLINKRYDTKIMHQSFTIPAPRGRGIVGLLTFQFSNLFLKRLSFGSKGALHCGAKFVVKSPPNAPHPLGLTMMNNNK